MKRNEVVEKHLDKFSKEEAIEYLTTYIQGMPDEKVIGFVKHFPFYETDNYETLQLTVQSANAGYLKSVIEEIQKDIPRFEEEVEKSHEDVKKHMSEVEELKKHNQRLYNQIIKDKENYIRAFSILNKEEELNKKLQQLEYKKEYLEKSKINLEYHTKALSNLEK